MIKIIFSILLGQAHAFATTSSNPQFVREILSSEQLNSKKVASCLRAAFPDISISQSDNKYHFGSFDLLLPFLAVYPGVRAPTPLDLVQDRALQKWSTHWEDKEEALAKAFVAHPPQFPHRALQMAAAVCGSEDFFCALLLNHNVLRTLGRYEKSTIKDPDSGEVKDFNPNWFKKERAQWIERSHLLQLRMVSLRKDDGGDRWGEWYHFFGILTYAVHAMAMGYGEDTVAFVAQMNEILNPWLAGGEEDPIKAQLDRDSAVIAWRWLNKMDAASSLESCDSRLSYLAEASLLH